MQSAYAIPLGSNSKGLLSFCVAKKALHSSSVGLTKSTSIAHQTKSRACAECLVGCYLLAGSQGVTLSVHPLSHRYSLRSSCEVALVDRREAASFLID